jgi:hypothetical protein
MGRIRDWTRKFVKIFSDGHDPDFLIIGAQKSGTTSLHYFLNQHPRLGGSFPKEVQFFSKYINYPGKDLRWYRKNFATVRKYDHYFESSPSYLNEIEVPRLIHEFYPDIKLIALLRDPVERAFSAWNMYRDYQVKGVAEKRLGDGKLPGQESELYKFFFKGRSSFPTFRETIESELSNIKNGIAGGSNILRKGLYYDQLMRYYAYFNRDQILILEFKELSKDPFATCQKALTFLNVESPDWRPKVEIKNKRSYTASMTEEERSILENFYREPDKKLFELLGVAPLW